MGLETSKRKEHKPIIIKIVEYENIDVVLSKMIVPFSEAISSFRVPDVYEGHERIPFEQRDPLYKKLMRKEFKGELNRFIKERMI